MEVRGFLQSLTVVLILINTLKARTLLGPRQYLRDVVSGQKDSFTELIATADKMSDNGNNAYRPDESGKDIQSGLFPIKLELSSENNIYPLANTQQDEHATNIDPILLQPQETLPSLSKEELEKNEFSQYPAEPKQLTGISREYKEDSFKTLPVIKQEIETIELSDCIKKLQSFFPNTLTNVGNVLPTHEQDTLPPLLNPLGDIKNEQFEIFEKGKLHEPLPPTITQVKLPDQSLIPIKESPIIPPVPDRDHVRPSQTSETKVFAEAALPINEESFPAHPVVPSGPYPAEVSILKEIPSAHVAEPLPPLQNGVFTKFDVTKHSSSLAPKEQLPDYFPGSPYLTTT